MQQFNIVKMHKCQNIGMRQNVQHREFLVGLARPCAGLRLAPRCELAEVFGAALRGRGAALLSQDSRRLCGYLRRKISCARYLIDEIFSERNRRAQQFAGSLRATLRKFSRGENQISFGDEIPKRAKFAG